MIDQILVFKYEQPRRSSFTFFPSISNRPLLYVVSILTISKLICEAMRWTSFLPLLGLVRGGGVCISNKRLGAAELHDHVEWPVTDDLALTASSETELNFGRRILPQMRLRLRAPRRIPSFRGTWNECDTYVNCR